MTIPERIMEEASTMLNKINLSVRWRKHAVETIARAIQAAEERGAARTIVVKPLEWETVTRQGRRVHVAKGFGCTYEVAAKVWNNGWIWVRVEDDSNLDAEDEYEAKAGAQADYEALIRSAITDPKGDGHE